MKRLFVLLFTLLVVGAQAQDVVVPNVSPKMRKFRGVESVEGLGHYCFVVDEKSKRGYKLFKLYIWDYDLNQIAKSTLELEKKSFVVDAVFNGSHFLVVFYDAKKDNVRSVSFDKEGEKVADKTIDGIKTKFMMAEDMQPSYYPAEEAGFFGIVPDKEKKFGFTISKYDNDLNEKWSTKYFPEKGVQVVMDAVSDGKKLMVLKYAKGSKMSKVVDVDMTAFGGVDGNELWSYDLNLKGRTLLPTEIAINEKGNVAVAGMYFDGEKISGINSDGIFFAHVDNSGDEISLVTKEWSGELQAFLKESKQSWTLGKPKVIFEDIIYDASKDEFKLVGELFTVNTAGKVLGMLNSFGGGGNNAETRISIEDLVVFTFSGQGGLEDFYSINKARTKIVLPSLLAGGLKIASALKQTGSLPFKYTSLDDKGQAIAFFIDFVKLDEDGNLTNQKIGSKLIGSRKVGVGMLNLSTSTIEEYDVKYLPLTKKTDKIDENSDVEFDGSRSVIQISEAKPGYVLISELTKKTGELKLFLEEIK